MAEQTVPHPDDLPDDLRPLSVRRRWISGTPICARMQNYCRRANGTVPDIAKRPWRAKSNRIFLSVWFVLAVAAVVAGILVLRQVKKPAARANPDSASQRQIALANTPAPSIQAKPADADKSKNPTQRLMSVAGKWKATAKYWDQSPYAETFDFEVEGTELSGTASCLGQSLNIFDGKIEGDRISFMTKSLTGLGDRLTKRRAVLQGHS